LAGWVVRPPLRDADREGWRFVFTDRNERLPLPLSTLEAETSGFTDECRKVH
jgi:hypothetical protein